jgi:hypothetical protein
MIKTVFEDLARSKKNLTTSSGGKAQAEGQIAFVKGRWDDFDGRA